MFEPGNTQADPLFAQGAALVVGGDNDLGEAICVLLAGAGSHVCLACNIDPLAAQRTAARVHALGQEAVVAPVDSSDPQALQAFATAAAAQFGSIHSLVVVPPPQATRARIGDIPPADWARSINAEANGCFNTIHAVLPHLRRARGSCVVLTAAAITKIPAQSSLSNVPKAATSMLVLALAKEEARHGVRDKCVAPVL